jgi:hypothetical protein
MRQYHQSCFFTVRDLYIFGGIGDFSGFGVPALYIG